MPGWGAKKDAEDCTMAGYVASAIGDIEDADLRDIVVVGHSFAGLTIPYIVTAIPERFKRVVFMACAVPDAGDSLRDLLVSMGKMDPCRADQAGRAAGAVQVGVGRRTVEPAAGAGSERNGSWPAWRRSSSGSGPCR